MFAGRLNSSIPRISSPKRRFPRPFQIRLRSPSDVSRILRTIPSASYAVGHWQVERSSREGLTIVSLSTSRDESAFLALAMLEGCLHWIRFLPQGNETKTQAFDRIRYALTMTSERIHLPFYDLLKEVFA